MKPPKAPTPLSWRNTPPQTQPERSQFAGDLEAVLRDSSIQYDHARAAFAATLLGLSGEELYSLGHLLCAQLKSEAVRPAAVGDAA